MRTPEQSRAYRLTHKAKLAMRAELDADSVARHTAELYGFCRAKGNGCRCGRPKKSDLLPRKRHQQRLIRAPLIGVEFMLADPCSYCGEPSEHFDHIEPLYRGGADEPENLTRACRRCNFAKNYQPLIVFLARRAA
jgi:5-methylcytosine-specific restriction endonuclease McrA